MIEKDAYSQQDIDYAFRLHDKEIKELQTKEEFGRDEDDVNAPVRDEYKSVSGIYITIFMDKFFKDLKDEWMKDEKQGGISMQDIKNTDIVRPWLDDYLTERINKKRNVFQMIVRGIYRSIQVAAPDKEVTEKMIMDKLAEVILHTVINKSFPPSPYNSNRVIYGSINLSNAITVMAKNSSKYKFGKIVNDMTKTCQNEEQDKELNVEQNRPQ